MNASEMLKIVIAICQVESSGHAVAFNDKDPTPARGYCQIRDIAAKDVGYKGTHKQLMDRDTNLVIATKYFEKQYARYKNSIKAIKAYNAGFAKTTHDSDYTNKVRAKYIALYGKRGF